MKQITLTMTEEQAESALKAFELLMRLSMGQIEYLTEMAREGALVKRMDDGKSQDLSVDEVDDINEGLMMIKRIMGHHETSNFGIRNENVPVDGKRAYELWKVIGQSLTISRGTAISGVRGEGLRESLTNEPIPKSSFSMS
ncbi:hypothetical protein ACXHQ0_16240 [Vibrio antiquarius]|uniref:Uncharacterized protein n=1 Tax=Vibrio parahaemolyticus TaxID=670 RepID=A0AA46Z5J9_VIBPH|nr:MULTISPECIES: hypothetical protein [Vibrio harveyi group]KOE96231.1 hypothetical protein ACS91_00370 [Vibrio parahaemolyticus]MCS0310882.1 hypothetical protein [Vibrio diabolicus]UYV29843.1 hypothetical protein M5598_28075 [Vibrio parahaemolyticus]UYW19116.1 hypothetical protein IF561_28220 [Vibrio parahaemolyticus]